jgi:hypothetical protein
MMRYTKVTVGLGVAALAASSAVAGPIPASPTVGSMGESVWWSTLSATDVGVNVDWMVIDATAFGYAGAFAYLYQLEATTAAASGPKQFSVTFDTAAAGVLAKGFQFGDDLDVANALHPAHVVAGESDAYTLKTTPASGTVTMDSATVTWNFPALTATGATRYETDVMYFISPNTPSYGNGNAADSVPPSPWAGAGTIFYSATNSKDSQPVPVPVPTPEPSEYLMAGLGLLGLAYLVRRKKLLAS